MHTRAVLPWPRSLRSCLTAAPQGTHGHAVSAELWTGGCRQQSLLAWLRDAPPGPPGKAQPRLQADSHSPRPGCGSLNAPAPGASAEALLQSRNTIGATHPDSHAWEGLPAAASLGHGEHGAPRAEVQGRPHPGSVALRQLSLPLSHTSYERRGWGQSGPLPHCPHLHPRRGPGLVVSQGRAPSAGAAMRDPTPTQGTR